MLFGVALLAAGLYFHISFLTGLGVVFVVISGLIRLFAIRSGPATGAQYQYNRPAERFPMQANEVRFGSPFGPKQY